MTDMTNMENILAASSDVIAIYQLKFDRTTDMIRFASTSQMLHMRKKIQLKNYELKYVTPTSAYGRPDDLCALLENVYAAFNISRPEDFSGHSLSISDIVALKGTDDIAYYYVDDIGFKNLKDIA